MRISTSFAPAGVTSFTTSPSRALSSARAIGEIQLTCPRVLSASSMPRMVTVANGKGALARVAAALAHAEADITHVDMDDERAQDATDLRFVVAVRDRSHLDSVLRNLRRTHSVMSAQRIRPGH